MNPLTPSPLSQGRGARHPFSLGRRGRGMRVMSLCSPAFAIPLRTRLLPPSLVLAEHAVLEIFVRRLAPEPHREEALHEAGPGNGALVLLADLHDRALARDVGDPDV